MKINAIDRMGEILKNYPETYGVFLANGFKADSADELMELMGKDTMIQTVLKIRGVNVELFIRELNERIASDDSQYELYDPNLPVNISAQATYPTMMRFKDGITEILKKHQQETGKKLNCYMVDSRGPSVECQGLGEKSIEDIPDIIMSKGFDEIYGKDFQDKFISPGHFENLLKDMEAEYRDPYYTLNAAMIKVMLIDEKKLGDLPRPKAWRDLLEPIYREKIVAFGNEGEVSKSTLVYLNKEYGQEAVARYAENVKSIQLGAKMLKTAGTDSAEGGAIYVLPLTFAKLCEREGVSIVWPEEGATVVPLSTLVKKDTAQEYKFFTDFLLNEYGQMYADISSISFNPEIENKVSKEQKINWLGWDYIYSNDVYRTGNQLKKQFHEVWDKKQA